jgi:hypothetical protein
VEEDRRRRGRREVEIDLDPTGVALAGPDPSGPVEIAKRCLSLSAMIASSSSRPRRSAASRSATGTQPFASSVRPALSGRCRSTIEMRRLTRTWSRESVLIGGAP